MDVTPSLADMAVQQLAEAFSGMARRPKASRRVKAPGIVLAAALSVLAPAACAASFDCGKASAADEHAVCDARALNDQDVRMALLFDLTQRLVPMGTRDDQKDAQVAFLAARRACGGERPCIAALYQRRIAELMAIMARVESNGPF